MLNENKYEYLKKFNSTDYSFNKGEKVERFLTKRTLETTHTYKSKEIYLRKTTNKFGTFNPGDNKVKVAFDTEERFNNILQCWKSISNYEQKDVLQVSSGLSHYVRNICIVDVDADNWNDWFVNDVKKLNPTYIIKTQSGHLQIGWMYKSSVSPKQNTKTFLLGNIAIRYIAAKNNILKDGQVYGDDNYTGWQCKNPYSKRNTQLYYNENNVTECNELQSMFSRLNNVMSTEYVNVDISKAEKRLYNSNINNSFSSSFYNSNKGNSSNNDCSDSRTVLLYNKLRTAITQIKNNKAKRNEEPTCSFDEAFKAALIIAKDNQLNKGMLPQNEIEATTRCTLKWVNANWKPFEKDSKRSSENMDRVRKFEKQIKDANFIILHGKIVEEKLRREKLGLSTSTRAIGDALGISCKTVSVHNRKTEYELMQYKINAEQFTVRVANSSKDSDLYRKYVDIVNEFNKVIEIYNTFFFSSIYNSNKGNSKSIVENTTETAINIAENNLMKWEDFYQSKDVWETLGCRPRINDYIKYIKRQLTIRGDFYERI